MHDTLQAETVSRFCRHRALFPAPPQYAHDGPSWEAHAAHAVVRGRGRAPERHVVFLSKLPRSRYVIRSPDRHRDGTPLVAQLRYALATQGRAKNAVTVPAGLRQGTGALPR